MITCCWDFKINCWPASFISLQPPPQLAAAELADAKRKKTDAVTPDDKVSDETAEASSDDDTDKMDGKDTGAAGDAQSSKSPRKSSPSKKSPSSKKASKSDLEADDVSVMRFPSARVLHAECICTPVQSLGRSTP